MTIKTPALAEEAIDPDEAAVATAFVEFLKATSTKHHPTGTVPRFNQGRAAGCVEAEFIVPDGLPQDLRVGLFAHPRTLQGADSIRATPHRSRTRSATFEACRSRLQAWVARI